MDPRAKVETLSVGQMQRVEILKALYRGADILILDEPTAVLTPIEVQEFFSALRQLRAEGKSIIIITHKLYEVMEIADRCTVLRDGQLIGSVDKDKTSMEQLASMMVGREYSFEGRHPSQAIGETFFSAVVTNSTLTFSDIAFLEIDRDIASLLNLADVYKRQVFNNLNALSG